MFTRHNTAFADIQSTIAVKGAIASLSCNAMLETEAGFRAASDLQAGDTVATLDGGFAPISWIGQSAYAISAHLVPAGALDNCSDLYLPSDTLVGIEAPMGFEAASDLISMPVSALEGHRGIRPATGPVKACTIGLETEEMIWTQTGTLLHARPMTDAFFQTLRFAEARAVMARFGTQDAVAA